MREAERDVARVHEVAVVTKREMLVHLDAELEVIRSRGIAARGSVEKGRLRRAFAATTAIRAAIERLVPNDVAPPEQRELKGVG